MPSPVGVYKMTGITEELVGMGTKIITLSLRWKLKKKKKEILNIETESGFQLSNQAITWVLVLLRCESSRQV